MLVKNDGGWGANPNPMSIRRALSHELRMPSQQGIAETASANALEAISFLAKLVELLHERGALTDDDVMKLLPPYWKKVDDPAK